MAIPINRLKEKMVLQDIQILTLMLTVVKVNMAMKLTKVIMALVGRKTQPITMQLIIMPINIMQLKSTEVAPSQIKRDMTKVQKQRDITKYLTKTNSKKITVSTIKPTEEDSLTNMEILMPNKQQKKVPTKKAATMTADLKKMNTEQVDKQIKEDQLVRIKNIMVLADMINFIRIMKTLLTKVEKATVQRKDILKVMFDCI